MSSTHGHDGSSYNAAMNQVATESPSAIVSEIERYLDQRLEALELPQSLREAIRYAVLGGGKRLRPQLALLCCEAVSGDRRLALGPAAALELVHGFSLVHDDLPAMDDETLRRGRPTLHIHAGEAMAVLAGDAMLALAFELVTGAGLDAARSIALVRELSGASIDMIAGQVYDTLGGFPPGLSEQACLQLTHRKKTEALLRASCRMGAICGGADDDQLSALTRYGEAVGLMFQIVDDLLDVTQSTEHAGKTTGKDESAGKLTFPGILGIDGSRTEVRRLVALAHESLASFSGSADPLRDLCDYMAVRTK